MKRVNPVLEEQTGTIPQGDVSKSKETRPGERFPPHRLNERHPTRISILPSCCTTPGRKAK
jgi:hypothetical protein